MSHPPPSMPVARRHRVAALVVLGLAVAGCCQPAVQEIAAVPAETPPRVLDVDRGRLLYDTHCVACHNRQVHWRDRSVVGSWSDLVIQADRWQTNSGQHWAASEIGDVAAYLNSLYYRMPCPSLGCSGASTVRAVVRRADPGPG
jgi:hypothetical protein